MERGKYGQVFKCKDLYNKGKFVAAKVSNSATIDIDNAKVESKLMEKLLQSYKDDNEGYDRLLHLKETLMIQNRVVIISEFLG